jgi:hypothetical protein
VGSGWPWAVVRVVTGPGWSGRGGGWPAGGGEEVQPLLLAVPSVGEVEGDVASAVPGGAGGDRDQVAADVAARALAKGRLARAPAARTRLCAIAAMDSQAAFAAKTPEGMCASGPLVMSAKTCSTIA